MTFVLSILAQAPQGNASSTRDLAVQSTLDHMESAIARKKLGYDACLKRATYVRDIGLILRSYQSKKPDILQIIGHGMAGRLELGSYWSKQALDEKLGPAVLDSNPESYGLLNHLIPEECKVFLLGCGVGASAPSGYIASGRALLFDLEDMSRASIYAADDIVTPEHFEDGFLYRGSLVTSNGKAANPAFFARSTARKPAGDLDSAVSLKLAKLQSAPALGFAEPLEQDDAKDLKEVFESYIPTAMEPLLAMPELIFDSNYGRAEVIMGGRYVRVEIDQQPVHFRAPNGDSGRDPADKMLALREAYLQQLHEQSNR